MVQAVESIGGQVLDSRFDGIDEIFRENFARGLESCGANFAVYHNGKLAVNLWGGVADRNTGQLWTENTMSILFSTTKSVAATVLALVMDHEGVSYDRKVSDFWPEFSRNGKQDVTVMNVVLHQAGLPYTQQMISRDDVIDWRRMSKYFEDAKPIWTPGTRTGYHALTFGFLIDQIVRRIDSRKRGVNDILEEILSEYGISDLSIGLRQASDNHRVATLECPGSLHVNAEDDRNLEVLRRWMAGDNEHHKKLYETWPWIKIDDYNNLENRLLPMPSNMGIGNAQSLAHFHSLLSERRILSEECYERLQEPKLQNEFDETIGYEENKGYGYQFTKNPTGHWIFGHSGFGGQNVRVDVHNNLSYAYVCNGLKISDADLVEPWRLLVDKMYSSIL
ncbi:Beta-lactamase [Parelaphostrongylus tenuis]|uniref:Beta-lactamase n=1 Tax=Parelaphostrongylus tenuis TaxID=148309 RepID=A0AAD5LVT7_PARTN|nr:Beta-lactamase [Parelaphostrongylus tenuis]